MKKMVIAVLAALLLVGVLVALAENNAKESAPTQDVPVDSASLDTLEATDGALTGETEQTEQTEQMEQTEQEQEIFMLGGEVTELGEDFFVMTDAELGEVQVNLGDDSAFDGVEPGELAVGQYVYVIYDGKITRSLPPQVFALRGSMYATAGSITELTEGKMTLVRDEIGDEVIISLPQDAPELSVGDHVTAYTTGIMTMSIPAQMNAVKVVRE